MMKVEYPHTLGKDVALEKIKAALVDAIGKYSDKVSDIKEEWNYCVGNISFSSYGFTLKVKIVVDDNIIYIEGKIPWLISSYSSKIEKILLDNIKRILEV